LLTRITQHLERNEKEDRKIHLPPPMLGREGRKVFWINFPDFCTRLKRSPDHLMQYTLTELGTTGNLDAGNRFIIKGRLRPNQIESILRHYLSEYVFCKTCKCSDTNLKKENRMQFVECHTCGSVRSVAIIQRGFNAVIEKRK
jgi:translation initiation factor 2 subunit 2